jgi:hypothetical protein
MKHIDVESDTHAELMALKYMLKHKDVGQTIQFLVDEWRAFSKAKKEKASA